jgi:hypothetical protein
MVAYTSSDSDDKDLGIPPPAAPPMPPHSHDYEASGLEQKFYDHFFSEEYEVDLVELAALR